MEIRQVVSPQEKDDAFHVRRVVFVDEQNVPEDLEIDEHDDTALHLVGYEQDEPVAAARLRFVGNYGKLERICVKRPFRGKKYGKEMILFMESLIKDHTYQASKLNAQTHAEAFYQSLGYETVSEEFMDAGIPHVTMTKTL
ncbi:Predicted N-acyltransferase, GNAT family [Halobacillus alkaliphilus]|uniref:Predicted N-acyltransferase, GNAT family n=1 Tax=Halobacillus alkaliphilus TaxID=396056 RepID=A0A1I2L4J1_9BACI|nr:GNAT family N-acetyltransferase [Halobacillus alkaliphilus]SFF73468.1 Predicted N-acyltransferase, GNAT family [Halobacillus alkaliphilus]